MRQNKRIKGFASDDPLPSDAFIVIPARNESRSVIAVIDSVRKYTAAEIVLVDDCSSDGTGSLARDHGVIVLPLAVQLGAWGAIQTGLRYALARGAAVVVTMDADGQHEAEFLKDLFEPIASGRADVSIGACTQRASRLRRIAWILLRKTSGVTLDDITSGFRAYSLKTLGSLTGMEATLLDYQDVGVLQLLQRHGWRIEDVEVNMKRRIAGKSRVFDSWAAVSVFMLRSLLLGISKRPIGRGK